MPQLRSDSLKAYEITEKAYANSPNTAMRLELSFRKNNIDVTEQVSLAEKVVIWNTYINSKAIQTMQSSSVATRVDPTKRRAEIEAEGVPTVKKRF